MIRTKITKEEALNSLRWLEDTNVFYDYMEVKQSGRLGEEVDKLLQFIGETEDYNVITKEQVCSMLTEAFKNEGMDVKVRHLRKRKIHPHYWHSNMVLNTEESMFVITGEKIVGENIPIKHTVVSEKNIDDCSGAELENYLTVNNTDFIKPEVMSIICKFFSKENSELIKVIEEER
jgi:hypothetical protein